MDADGLEQEHGTKAPALLGETALLQEQDDSYALVQRSYRCGLAQLLCRGSTDVLQGNASASLNAWDAAGA